MCQNILIFFFTNQYGEGKNVLDPIAGEIFKDPVAGFFSIGFGSSFYLRVGSGESLPGSATLRTVNWVVRECPHGRKVCPWRYRPATVYNAYLGIRGLQMVPCQRIFARISTKEILLCGVLLDLPY